MAENKRKRSRLSLQSEITVGIGGKNNIAGKIKDVSMNGVFLQCGERFPLGSVCGIEIILTGKSSNLRIRARGKVTRHAPDGMGVRFEHDLEWWPVLEDKCIESLELNLREKPY